MTQAALGLAFMGAPLFFWLGAADPYVLPKLALLAACACAAVLSGRRHAPQSHPLDLAVLVWLLASVVTALAGIDKARSAFGEYSSQAFELLPSCIAALLYFAASRAPDRLDLPRLGAAAAAVIGVYGIAQAFGLDPVKFWPLQGGRIGSTLGSPVYAGAMLAVLTPCLLEHGSWVFGAAAGVGLALTYSRGSWLAAIAAAAVWHHVSSREKSLTRVLLPVGLATAAVLLSWHAASDFGRIEIWRVAWKAFAAHPILGTGPGTFLLDSRALRSPLYIVLHHSSLSAAVSAHNDWLHVAATMGLAGLAAYAYLHAKALRCAGDPLAIATLTAWAVQAKVNPVPFAATACAAIIVGQAMRTEENGSAWDARVHRWLAPAASIACAALCTLFLLADHAYARVVTSGTADGDAAILWPFEMRYAEARVSYLNSRAMSEPAPGRGRLMDASMRTAMLSTWLHPRDAQAHDVASQSYALVAGLTGDATAFQSAVNEIAESRRLAPLFLPNTVSMAKMCAVAGNADCLRRARVEYGLITGLEKM